VLFTFILTLGIILGPLLIEVIRGARTGADVHFVVRGYLWAGVSFFTVILMMVTAWGYSAMIAAVGFKGGDVAPIAGSMKRGIKRFLPFLVMMIITSLASFGGSLFFFFPALILATGFSLARYVMVLEDVSWFQALGTSWRITKGLKWSIFGRLLLMFLVMMGGTIIISLFPIISFIILPIVIQFILPPYMLAYIYCIYEDVRAVRKDVYGLSGGITAALIIFSIVTIVIAIGVVLSISHLGHIFK